MYAISINRPMIASVTLNNKRIDMPPPGQVNVTFQRAPKARGEVGTHAPSIWDSGEASNREGSDEE